MLNYIESSNNGKVVKTYLFQCSKDMRPKHPAVPSESFTVDPRRFPATDFLLRIMHDADTVEADMDDEYIYDQIQEYLDENPIVTVNHYNGPDPESMTKLEKINYDLGERSSMLHRLYASEIITYSEYKRKMKDLSRYSDEVNESFEEKEKIRKIKSEKAKKRFDLMSDDDLLRCKDENGKIYRTVRLELKNRGYKYSQKNGWHKE